MKEMIINILQKALAKKKIKLSVEEIDKFLEVPPKIDMGDFAFPCFFLAEKLKTNPHRIALELREEIGNFSSDFDDIQTSGAYVNFFVNRKEMTGHLLKSILVSKEKFGGSNLGGKKKIVVEFSSPNIAKPFGIGHLRSTIIGNSLANICQSIGFNPVKINYLGDWGTQFGKLLFGYERFGDEKKLEKDPIKHLLEIYVKVSGNKDNDDISRIYFKNLENGDEKLLSLWKKFREFSLKDFAKIYRTLGISFDEYSGESMFGEKMKAVIEELKNKNLLVKSEGALIVNLKKYNLGVCLIQKSDGSTLYATRDIAAAIERHKKYKFEKMIYEVGHEQTYHFNQIFKVLELMGYEWAKNCVHAGHGLYLDKDGKRFATRKGKTVFMEDILDETISFAKKEIKKRFPKISSKELDKRGLAVAKAAIFYGDLKNNRANDMMFDIRKFVYFEGDTGPYILYSYARASSILKKIKDKSLVEKVAMGKKNLSAIIPKSEDFESSELELIKKLGIFPQIILRAYKDLSPSVIANYSYALAQIFNEFYHACPVINSEHEQFRIILVECFRIVLRNSLNLLGIETLNEM